MVQLGLTQLTELRFLNCPCWFGHSETQQYLLDFIQEQTCLEILHLSKAPLGSAPTAQLFSFLVQSSNINTIVELDLYESCDFSSDDTCDLLAKVVDVAPLLEKCIIKYQIGERKIVAELELATEG